MQSSRILKELCEDLNSIKHPVTNEGYTNWNKEQFIVETTVEWMKPRIKSMIWNIRKQTRTNQNNNKKRESKKAKIV